MGDFFKQYALAFIFISAHELGHIIMALSMGEKLQRLRILPIGLNAVIGNTRCGRRGRLLIYLAGPFVNMAMAAVFIIAEGFKLNAAINVSLAIFNMIPIQPLDGGRVAMELLTVRLGLYSADRRLKRVSLLVSLAIIGMGLMVFYRTGYNISIMLVGIYICLCLWRNKGEIAFMNIKNLLFRRERILKKGVYSVRQIVILKSMKICDAIKAMDYTDMYHMVYIMDETLKIVQVMTEQEILDASIEKGVEARLEEILVKT